MKKPFILVTGSSGVIGTGLCEGLLKKGLDFCGIDLVSNRWNQRVNEKTVCLDLRNPAEFEKIPKQADFFVHLAANPYVFPSVQNPQLAFDNVLLLLNSLEFCRKQGIKRFLFASSREVYGNAEKGLWKESDFRLENVESPYAASKVAGEAFIQAYQKCFGIDFEILRFSNVYGRYDNSERLIPLIIQKSKKNEVITVFGGKKELPFTYLDDAVEAILLGISRFENAKNQCYNIAYPKPTRIVDVVQILQKKMGVSEKMVVSTRRTGEVERFCADVSNARKRLGFEAKTGIEEGFAKTLEWYEREIYRK